MLFPPLTLEALALRQVIQERGIKHLPSGLVPRMRKELEELAKLPGVYEIVDIQEHIYKEGKEVENKRPMFELNLGAKIKVSCPTGSAWTVGTGVYEKEFSLRQQAIAPPNGFTYSHDVFVEDGVLKWEERMQGEGKKKASVIHGLTSFQLDQRGCLVWTCRVYSKKENETLLGTIWAKRICSKEPNRLGFVQLFIAALGIVKDAITSTVN